MVDKAIFIDSSSANNSMNELEILSNNLANVNTVAFRSDHESYKSVPVKDDANNARVYASLQKTYSDFTPGPVTTTGRDLDIAFNGPGFFAVQSADGEEAYTRSGDLQIKNNFLTTRAGNFVKGANGMISVPPEAERVMISQDGTVSVKMPNQTDVETVGQIKLTNPAISSLKKGADGLFYPTDNQTIKPDSSIKLTPNALEGSNVSAIQTLTQLIELSRRFEFHTNLMKNFEDASSEANKILSLTS